MAKHNKTKSPRWRCGRVHYAVDKLPDELRVAIKRMIVDGKWPDNFEGHYSGLPRYRDIILYCKEKGHKISHSAIGRFAKQLQTVSALKITNDFRNYTVAYLAVLSLEFANIQSDIEVSVDNDGREALEKLREKKIDRIEEVIASLRKLDNSYPGPIHGG
jgi:hypothetical protein